MKLSKLQAPSPDLIARHSPAICCLGITLLICLSSVQAQNFTGWQTAEWALSPNTEVLQPSYVGEPYGGGIKKYTGPNNAWNADAVSLQQILGDGAVEFQIGTPSHLAVGLNLVNTSRTNTDLDYAFQVTPNGTTTIHEKGVSKATLTLTHVGTVLSIRRAGALVEYLRDGQLVYTSAAPSHGRLFADCSFYTLNSTISECRILNGDKDADGLPDYWEYQFLSANPSWSDLVVFQPDGDPDSDDVSNLQEFLDGTDPLDPLSKRRAVSWTALRGVTLSGADESGLTKLQNGANAWDADALSTQIIQWDGELSFQAPPGSSLAVGLSSTGNATSSQTDLTYGIVLATNGTAAAKRPESGTNFALGEHTSDTILTIRRSGGQVSFLKDGVTFHTSTTLSSGPLKVDCSLYTPGAGFTSCRIDDDNLDGDTMPDSWERRYLPPGSDLADLEDFTPEGDPDSDTRPNLQEYLEGTHPLVRTSFTSRVMWTPSSAAVVAVGTQGGVKKVSGGDSWTTADAVATKRVPFSGRLTFRVTAGSRLAVGLNLVDNSRSYSDLDHSILITAAGTASVYQGATAKASLGTHTADTYYSIQRIGGLIEFYKDGQLRYSTTCHPTAQYLVDSAFYTVGSEVSYAHLHIGDIDEDGIPDEAEIAAIIALYIAQYGHLSDTTVNSQQLREDFLPGDDSDGDGVPNLDEYHMGTDMARADSAPEVIVWQDRVNTTPLSGSLGGLEKTSGGTSAYDADAVASRLLISDGGVCFKAAPSGTLAMGLTYENNNQALTDLEYAFVLTTTTLTVKRPESATNLTIPGAYTAATHFQIRRIGSTIEYVVDGAVAYTSTTPAVGPLRIDCSIYSRNHEFSSAWFISGDLDEDGIPDAYELAHGLNPSLDDALADADGDQIPNLWEYERGTSASDPASQPQADAVVAPWLENDLPELSRYRTILGAYNSLPTSTAYRSIIRVLPGPVPYDSTLGSADPPQHLPRKVAIIAQPPFPAGVRMPVLLSSTFLNFRDEAVLDGFVIAGSPYNQSSVMCMPASGFVTPPRVRLVNCLFRDCNPQITPASLLGGAVTNLGARLEVEHCTFYQCNSYEVQEEEPYEQQYIASLSNISGTLVLKNSIIWDAPFDSYRLPPASPLISNAGLLIIVENCIIRGGAFDSIATDPALDDSYGNDQTSRRGGLTWLSSAAMGTAGISRNARDFRGDVRPWSEADLGPEQWLNSFRDTDNDGLVDRDEMHWFGDLARTKLTDTDGDGVPDYLEVTVYQTNPLLADTNGDGTPDGFLGSFTSIDQDGDGLTNAQEAALGTDPRNPDTDGDGVIDSLDAFPLNAMMWQAIAANPADTTPPEITLDEPLDATLLP